MSSNKQKSVIFESDALFRGRFEQVFMSPGTLLAAANTQSSRQRIDELLDLLNLDEFDREQAQWFKRGMKTFGDSWDYGDSLLVLNRAGHLMHPENYLEIGVRRGRSVCALAFDTPDTNLFMFDLWEEDYANMPNASPEFVDTQLDLIGHKGSRNYFKGDVRKKLPSFIKEQRDCKFDIINVDGDHSIKGAKRDLETAYHLLKVGGVLCFDDICHPSHICLERVWDNFINKHHDLIAKKYVGLGRGVGVAVKLDIRKKPQSFLQSFLGRL